MTTKLSVFDVSEYLKDETSIAEYLSAVLEEDDPKLLLAAIGDIAKAQGMSKIASESGLGRESLYKALNSEAKPRFDTIFKVLKALGVNISFTPKPVKRIGRKKIQKRPSLQGVQKKFKKSYA